MSWIRNTDSKIINIVAARGIASGHRVVVLSTTVKRYSKNLKTGPTAHRYRNMRTLTKEKIKFYSYMGKFRVEQLQSHIWLTASSYIGKYLLISSYFRKPFLIYDFATAPLNFLIYEEN
jgi:hypothetical protein